MTFKDIFIKYCTTEIPNGNTTLFSFKEARSTYKNDYGVMLLYDQMRTRLRLAKKRHRNGMDIEECFEMFIESIQPQTVESKLTVNEKADFSMFDDWDEISDGEFEVPQDYQVEAGMGLVMSDIHFPYHVKPVLELIISDAYARGIDWIALNGDILDCYQLSAWEKSTTRAGFRRELDVAGSFIQYLRGKFPKAQIFYTEGNHETRLRRYILQHAKALEGMISIEELLKLRNFGVDWVEDNRLCVVGDLMIHHGHKFAGSGVNVAANKYRKAQGNLLFGHHHKTQDHFQTDLKGQTHGAWATGCLCDLRPDYAKLPTGWNHGFAYVDSQSNGRFHVDNKKIIDGRIC